MALLNHFHLKWKKFVYFSANRFDFKTETRIKVSQQNKNRCESNVCWSLNEVKLIADCSVRTHWKANNKENCNLTRFIVHKIKIISKFIGLFTPKWNKTYSQATTTTFTIPCDAIKFNETFILLYILLYISILCYFVYWNWNTPTKL